MTARVVVEPAPASTLPEAVTPVGDPGGAELRARLALHPLQSLFTSAPWLEVIERSYGFKIQWVTTGTGASTAALPFVELDDLRGRRLVSLPYCDFCDPLCADAASWRRLATPLLETGLPWRLRTLRCALPGGDPRLDRQGGGLWHGRRLDPDTNSLWAELGGSARRNVRHAEGCGVVVHEGRSGDDVRRFRALHTHLRKVKYRLLPQPAAFFDQIYECFAGEDRLTVLLAMLNGTPVAGLLLLQWRDVLYYKFNASTETEARPNDLLAWHAIRLGAERGLRLLDFGISDLDQPGLIRYKRKFASEEREIVFWAPARPPVSDPRRDDASRVLAEVTRLLTDPSVPDAITAAAGDRLYRLFP